MKLLKEIYQKLCDIEIRLKMIELKDAMGQHKHFIPILEDIAKKCSEFQGFTITKSTIGKDYLTPATTIQCSCGSPNHCIILCDIINDPHLEQYLDELKEKYKIKPLPKISNPIERINI
jgi:hypothetical protein